MALPVGNSIRIRATCHDRGVATARKEDPPRPRDFLRRRRPEYFSDTPSAGRPRLDRTILEYHLSTLTSRNQELDFEKFALALCSRTVAPNLVPHTGPTGGGDSKVDTETFPVATELSLSWFVTEAEAASRERWAFAFSAKADWKPKVKSDVSKIAETGRGYPRAFFVSSQSIPDRDRASIEDDLRTTHGLELRIFDRNWILDRVFEGHYEELVVSLLGLKVELAAPPRPGPLDASRQHRLAEIEDDIKGAVEGRAVGPRVVDLAIEAAVIARELEHSRDEVDGRLGRAERLARRHGLPEQEAHVAYERVWTAYWWHEDGPAFASALEQHETLVGAAPGITALRRLVTLFYLAAAGIAGTWAADKEWLAARRVIVDATIEQIAAKDAAPSASLSAKFTGALLRMFDDPEQTDEAFQQMTLLVDQAEGLMGFDLGELAEELAELGSMLPPSTAFEALHDRLVREVQRRTGDMTAGELYTDRAVRLYLAGRYPDAIATAGRALPLLVGLESRQTMLRALDVIGDSYLQMGLPWAARGAWLFASALTGPDSSTTAASLPRLVHVLDRLRSVELSIGRLPQTLSVHRIYTAAAGAAAIDSPDLRDSIASADVRFEAALAYALMRLPPAALVAVSRLPDLLARQGLDVARSALLIALGREDEVSETLGSVEETLDFLRKLRDFPEGPQLDAAQFEPSRTRKIRSRVLGVTIVAEHEQGSPGTEIAESCLGALEALLATGASHNIIGATPTVRLSIRRGHFTPWPFRIASRATDDEALIEIAYAQFDPSALTKGEQDGIRDALREVVTRVLARAFYLGPIAATLEGLLGDERALDRSLNFGLSFVTAGDLMGETHSRGLASLLDGTERTYDLRSDAPQWKPPIRKGPRSNRGDPPDLRTLRHDRMRVGRTVIDVPLWDRAQWKGLFFAVREAAPPLLALGFRDATAARRIWEGWTATPGELDDILQVSIVTDVNPKRPFDYRVLVTPNWQHLRDDDHDGHVEVVFDTIRMHEMNTESDLNLQTFRNAYGQARVASLGIAVMPAGDVKLEGVRLIGSRPMSSISIRSFRDLSETDWEYELITAKQEGLEERKGSDDA